MCRLISKSVKSVHTLIGHILCIIQNNCTNKNNVTRIYMATKYPIIKDRPISDTHNQWRIQDYELGGGGRNLYTQAEDQCQRGEVSRGVPPPPPRLGKK